MPDYTEILLTENLMTQSLDLVSVPLSQAGVGYIVSYRIGDVLHHGIVRKQITVCPDAHDFLSSLKPIYPAEQAWFPTYRREPRQS